MWRDSQFVAPLFHTLGWAGISSKDVFASLRITPGPGADAGVKFAVKPHFEIWKKLIKLASICNRFIRERLLK